MEKAKSKELNFPAWVKAKGGLSLKDIVNSENYDDIIAEFCKEIGIRPEFIKDFIKMEKARQKRENDIANNIAAYTPIVLTAIILFADYFVGFLSEGWRGVLFFILGAGVLVVFIKNTVKEAIKENK